MSAATPLEAGAHGRVEAVCVVAALHDDDGSVGTTAIDKRPVTAPVRIGPLGLRADVQADRTHHGGADQAVYLYDRAEAEHWSAQLGREIPAGSFGENLRISGMRIDDLEIGSRLRIGSALLEVTAPRAPCATFERWVGIEGFRRRFHERGRTGVYCRVIEPGEVRAGDEIVCVSAPGHGASVARVYAGARDAALTRTLDAWSRETGTPLHRELVARGARLLSREA